MEMATGHPADAGPPPVFALNPGARSYAIDDADTEARRPLDFHRRLPGYAPTPLSAAPVLAEDLGIGRVWVKDESSRLGLPAFKILGASWATYRAVVRRLGIHDDGIDHEGSDLDDLRLRLAGGGRLALAAATDGNHGRAVARVARLLGLGARIFVPAGTAAARIDAIAGEGATVTVVDGTYEDAVARSAEEAGPHCLVISDTSWPGYTEIPRWVIDGYSTIFREVDDELGRRGEAPVDVVVVQMGVGSLAAAGVGHYRRPGAHPHPALLGVEPVRAACVLTSVVAGEPVTVPGPHVSIMAGLNCGRPSLVAWPLVSHGVDVFCAIDDAWARWGMRRLADVGIEAGESGAAGLAGLAAVATAPNAAPAREALALGPDAGVLLICTEGATDPDAYRRILEGTG